MIKRKKLGKNGLTLIEVLIAMAFISVVYAFVVQVFFHGFKNITRGDIKDEGVRLARNEMIRLSSIENPIFIGLQYKDEGDSYINKIKSKEIAPFDLIQDGIITIGVKEIIVTETSSSNTPNAEEIKRASNDRANYERTVEWQVDDVNPVIVHLWVTVKWSDPQKEFPDETYFLETIFTP